MEQMEQKQSGAHRWWKPVLLTLLAIVLIFVFYIAVVMGQPQTDVTGMPRIAADQPLPEPLAGPIAIADDKSLGNLAGVFPAPVMFAGGKALTFLNGVCEDVPFGDGVARVVTLTYRTAEFDTLTVQSIYPARALSLLGQEGRSFIGVSVDNMAGLKYVGMQDAATRRMHAQGEEALYVFTTPLAEYRVIDQWTNTLQLFRPAE